MQDSYLKELHELTMCFDDKYYNTAKIVCQESDTTLYDNCQYSGNLPIQTAKNLLAPPLQKLRKSSSPLRKL